MDPNLWHNITLMAQPATPSEAQLAALLDDWQRYFDAFDIAERQQQAEFNGIMRARVQAGSVSLVAPAKE